MSLRRLIRARLAAEDGWALATAIILMAIMLSIGLATFAMVDQQTKESGIQRTRETAFNFAEGTLNAQVFNLTQNWPGPGAAGNPFPTCTQASTDGRCPSAATLTSLYNSVDTSAGAVWQTRVVDNNASGGINFYSDSITGSTAGYDANEDGRLWVRAQATARGKTRTLIALVRVEEQVEELPRNALLAGHLSISNNGHKIIIDGGLSANPAAVVRCTPALLELKTCLGHKIGGGLVGTLDSLLSLLNHQVNGNTVTGYNGGNALTPTQLARIKAKAIADGTFYATCPTADKLAGATVWIDSGNCVYQSNSVFNSEASPGTLFVNGTINLDGTAQFYGLIYGVNPSNSTGTIVDIEGNATVHGGVIVDGQGTVVAGSSKLNIVLLDNAFDAVKSYGTAGIVQNTWREIRSTS